MTPLQMALVAAGVANNGKIMQPHLVKKVTSPTGGTVLRIKPQVWRTAMKPETAAGAQSDDAGRRPIGHGHHAQIPGVKVAGKTGTAETGLSHVYTAWFIFFAPADDPQVAGAVVARAPAERLRRGGLRADRKAADAGDPALRVEGVAGFV